MRLFSLKSSVHLLAILMLSSVVPTDAVANSMEELAGALVKLRVEIDGLTDEIETTKRMSRERRRAFESQKAQLEAELQREQVRHAQLSESKDRKKLKIDTAKTSEAALVPVFDKAANQLESYIRQGIPFRVQDRLKEVKTLRQRLSDGVMTPGMALSRLWSLVEDEQRMSRDTGLFRDTIEVNGQATMVDVIRMGNVGLYFRSGDNRVGRIVRRKNKWITEFIIDGQGQERVLHLFELFKKQIRVGFFDLPSILPEDGK